MQLLSSLQGNSSSVIRQNGESQNGCFEKTKHAKFSENSTCLTPLYAHARVRIGFKKCLFFRKFGKLCFLLTADLKFSLLPYYRRVNGFKSTSTSLQFIMLSAHQR